MEGGEILDSLAEYTDRREGGKRDVLVVVRVEGGVVLTSILVYFSNGLCPRLHISYIRHPKLHTSLAVEYFL